MIWSKKSGTKLAILQERVTTALPLPVDAEASVEILSGSLPNGLRLSGINIIGTPFQVARSTLFRFVLRATVPSGQKEDRTYSIEVQGADEPIWVTEEDLLPLGNNEAYYILDNSPVDFQLQAIDGDLSTGQLLKFFVAQGDGEIPPGLTLTETGRLVGVVDPILALQSGAVGGYDQDDFDRNPFDFAIKSANGFDSFYYDTTVYGKSTPTIVPKKLNRYYEFIVTVSDGDTFKKRRFRIFVVGDDFFRADNTIMQVGTGIFTADNTFIRTPIWLTPRDLGFRRANNYLTLFLDVLDNNTIAGSVTYSLMETNDDGSPSVLPPGTNLDAETGEIIGRVPYQPAVTKEYKFTVKASRNTIGESVVADSEKTFVVKLLGEVESTINWLTSADLGDISSNYVSTLKVEAQTTVPNAVLLYTVTSGRLPPGLELGFNGEIIGKINSFGNTDNLGLTVFDNANFTLDGNSTSIDRDYKFTVQARDQFGFSAITREFTITVSDPDDKLYSNIFYKPLFNQDQRSLFFQFVGDPEVFNPEYLYRANDPSFGLQKDPKILVYAGIETVLANRYVAAFANTAKRKTLKINGVKTAVAKTPGTNDVVYEVVYLELLDPYEKDKNVPKSIKIKNPEKILVNSIRTTPDNPFYNTIDSGYVTVGTRGNPVNKIYFTNNLPIETREGTVEWLLTDEGKLTLNNSDEIDFDFETGSSTNIFYRPKYENTVRADSSSIKVSDPNDNTRYISNITNIREAVKSIGATEKNYLPLWMRSAQENSVQELGYVLALPLCFCKQGTSEIIKAAIEFSNFNYKQFNLDIDRCLIDSTEGIGDEKFFVFANYRYNL